MEVIKRDKKIHRHVGNSRVTPSVDIRVVKKLMVGFYESFLNL
jgi:hypothetical protein